MKRFHVSKNMFDKDNDYYSTEASLNVNDRRWLTYSNSASIKMICKPNTTYTISVPEELPLFRVAESNNKDILPTSQGTPITLVAALSDAKQFTFTTAADTECIIFQGSFSLRDTWHNYLMICEGSMALPYEPYGDTWQTKSPPRYETATDAVTSLPVTIFTDGQPVSSYTIKGNTETSGTPSPSNPITIEGVGEKTANLFNVNRTQSNVFTLDETKWFIGAASQSTVSNNATVSITNNTVEVVSLNAGYGCMFMIPVEPLTQYSISVEVNKISSGSYFGYSFRDTSGNVLHQTSSSMPEATITTVQNTAYLNLCLRFPPADGAVTYSNIMIVEGSTAPSSYIPYGYKISISSNQTALTPVYLTEQLMKINDYADSLASSGTVTYQIKKLVLTGAEDWVRTVNGKCYYINAAKGCPTDYLKSNIITVICSHYAGQRNTSSGSNEVNEGCVCFFIGGGYELYIGERTITSAADFKTYLQQQYAAGTPVTVWYVLATPTTESVTAPTIPTTGGTATIDVDTTVKPSEMDLTYHGWHEHEPLKRENGSWV